MNTYKRAKKSIFAALIIAVLILAGITLSSSFIMRENGLAYHEIKGEVTLPCTLEEPDGNIARYYATGDMRFRYAHDEYGYILMEDSEGYLVYARNKNGRPVPGKVRYNADAAQVARAPKMSYTDIDFEANPDLISDWEGPDYSEPGLLQSEPDAVIVNIIIFIEFNNSSFDVPEDNFASLLTASDNSLKSYYSALTYGNIDFESAYPKTAAQSIFVYKAPQNRSYYNVSGDNRYSREAILLTDAVNAVSGMISTPYNLDTDGNDRIDAVTFIMDGSASSTWGSLLWPHTWNLYDANEKYNDSKSAKIGGIEVGKFNMQFEESINRGVLCHEMGHVLGAPDLYHYDDPQSYAPVGKWDLMQSNTATPQFMTTHLRQKYIGYVLGEQIGEIAYNGIYSLKPTVTATQNDVLAYKIMPNAYPNEYFMVEYRNNTLSPYDSSLPGSGLIVYRINTIAQEGNRKAKYRDPANPDEVYVFRPNVTSTGTIEQKSRQNLEHAYLAPNNPYFTSVGRGLEYSSSAYDNQTIYYSNGSNSGIIIEVLSMHSEAIEFNVRLSGEDTIHNDYFTSRVSLGQAAFVNSMLFSGVLANVNFSEIDLSYLRSMRAELLDEQDNIICVNSLNLAAFYTAYNTGARNFPVQFIVNDKSNTISGVFDRTEFTNYDKPHRVRLIAEDADSDEIQLGTVTVDETSCSWEEVLSTKRDIIPALSASTAETVGLRFDGTVVSSGYYDYAVFSDIIAISSAHNHTLLLSKGMTVQSMSNTSHSKLNVQGWREIVKISASKDNSYGVDLTGRVYAAGDNTYGQLSVTNYENAADIKGGEKHVVILGNDGRVYGAGDNTYGQLDFSNWSDIVAVDAGDTFTVGLREGGNVLVAGRINGATVSLGWGNIVRISAGKDYILALSADGRVYSYGNNQGGKADTADLRDIVDLSAGDTHSAFLRMDGVVLYKGNNPQATHALENLLTDDYIPLTGINLNVSALELELSVTFKVEVSAQPSDATYQKYDFTSSDESVATVDQDGMINTHSEGQAVIRVTHRGSSVFAELTLTVTDPVLIQSVSFDLPQRNIVILDESYLTVITVPANATNRNKGTFSSGNTDIVEVNPVTGRIIGKALGDAVITVTINDFGVVKTAQCTITVIDRVDHLAIVSHIGKRYYDYGESLALEGGVVRVTTVGGQEYDLPMTLDMISGYNPYDISAEGQDITVTIDQKTVSFRVWVYDYAVSLIVKQPIKTLYEFGEALSVAGGRVAKVYASGAESESAAITEQMISGYDAYKFGEQTLTLSYEGLEISIIVTITDPISFISTNFSKKTFAYGEHIGEDETFKITRLSGAVEYLDIAYAILSGFNPYILGTHNITLTYQDKQAEDVFMVQDNIDSVQLNGIRRENRFMFFDNSYPMITLRAVFEGGGEFNISPDESDYLYGVYYYQNNPLGVADFTQANLGERPLTELKVFCKTRVSGGGTQDIFLASVSVELINIIEVKQIEVLYQPTYKRSLITSVADLDIRVRVTDVNDNVTTDIPDSVSVDLNIFTAQSVRVSYLGFIETVQITLINDPVALECASGVQLGYGSPFAGSVYLVRFNGDRQLLYADEYEVVGFDSYVLGTQTITIEYQIAGGQTISLEIAVTIIEDIERIALSLTDSEEYLLGETVDLDGKIIIITYLSQATREVAFDGQVFEILPYDNTVAGQQMITIRHIASGKTCYYEAEFLDYILEIRVDPQSKSIYEYDEQLSLTAVYQVWASGAQIPFTAYTTNYDPHKLGVQNIRITYLSFECLFAVTVVDVVNTLRLLSAPAKVIYNYGEAINLTGLTLEATYSSGAVVQVADYSLLQTAYNPTKIGEQSVTVTLGAKSCAFTVTIRPIPSPLFVYPEEELKVYTGKVMIYQSLRLSEVFDKIRLNDFYSYLDISLTTLQGERIDHTLPEYASLYLSGNYKILVSNGAGQQIVSLNINIYGDMNNDGVFSPDDLGVFASEFVKGSKGEEVDYDGDGAYDLIDFINWVKAANNKADPKPLLLFFQNLVAPPQRKQYL
jgi:M6 family metalloprotease-like protein